MPKLPVLKPLEVIKKYKRLGFVEDHQTGSHVILYHPKTYKRAVIPLHTKDLPKGTLKAILRESEVKADEFLNA